MQGSQGPSLRTSKYIYGTQAKTVTQSILDGYPAKGMPAFGGVLSAEEITSLVEFLADKRLNNDPEYLAKLDEKQKQKIENTVFHTELHDFRLEIIAELDKPWAMAVLPDGRLLITEEKTAQLRVIKKGELLPEPIKNTPKGAPVDIFKRVLIDVLAHPDYENNGWIYLTSGDSVVGDNGKKTNLLRLIRGRIKNYRWVDSEILFSVPRDTATGKMAFDDKGYLYFSASADLSVDYDKRPDPFSKAELVNHPSQNINSPEGKIYRLRDDGSLPENNPFAGVSDIADAVWSYGHRNPQGLAFDLNTKTLWSTEHGPRGGDELNIIRRANNYGWPVITYGTRYDGISITRDIKQEGLQAPVINWTPSIGVSSIMFYTGNAFNQWKNDLLVGSLIQEELMRVRLNNDKVAVKELLLSGVGRIRDIELGANGELYIALELKRQGVIVRLIPIVVEDTRPN